ncbi:MAG: hypothetical protein LC725_06750 [Lentisphaerae bacterium]|nr:hypothetical protein [Lentisphaerota bacterium]
MGDKPQRSAGAARRSFAAIAVSYFMGLFNDNFYKEAAFTCWRPRRAAGGPIAMPRGG